MDVRSGPRAPGNGWLGASLLELERLCRFEVRRAGLLPQECDDVFQEAVARTLRLVRDGHDPEKLRSPAWQRLLLRNIAFERRRALRRVRLTECPDSLPATPPQASESRSLRCVLREHGHVLTPRQREALQVVPGRMTFAEAARALRIGRTALLARLDRACVRLADQARSA